MALAPDEQTLVFTILGHLFSVPSSGGPADQLTFGPYYDDEPVFSPDGMQIAFTSDRDGSEGNIFVLSLRDPANRAAIARRTCLGATVGSRWQIDRVSAVRGEDTPATGDGCAHVHRGGRTRGHQHACKAD